jgi:sporulation protein YlmC with PRC-barrel domain
MTAHEHTPVFLDHEVIQQDGESIGKITDVVFDPHSGRARWAVVKPGPLRRAHYMPLREAYHSDDGAVVVPYRKATVTAAPAAAADHVLTEDEERELEAHYA